MTTELEQPIEIRYPPSIRVVFLLLAIILPVVMAVGCNVSEEQPPPAAWAVIGIIEAVFLYLVFISFRFLVKADDREVYHREIVERRIPLDSVEKIHMAEVVKKAAAGALSVKHAKIEILGNNRRILIAWQASKLKPLILFLAQRFPDKIEAAESLPDV